MAPPVYVLPKIVVPVSMLPLIVPADSVKLVRSTSFGPRGIALHFEMLSSKKVAKTVN